MSDKPRAVTVKILEKEYRVACPIGEHDSLRQSAQEVDRKMRELRKAAGRVLNTDRLAVMVALNLAHELLNTKSQVNHIDGDVLDRIDTMQSRITETIKTVSK